jgi:type IV pilus assembly protein PilO
MPISIKVLGSYHDLGAFATDISKLSRIVTLNNISITSTTSTNKDANKDTKSVATSSILTMEAVAKTYRYLDADELAEKRKTEKAAKAKSAKKG